MRKSNILLFACALIIGSLTYLSLSRATTISPSAIQQSPIKPSPTPASTRVPRKAREEILAAAKLHKVQINRDRITYVDNPKVTVLRAWITGIDKYTETDFQKGAPVLLMIVKAKNKLAIPNGSYVVEFLYDREGQTARAIFKNPEGATVADQKLEPPGLTLPDDSNVGGQMEPIPICETYDEIFRSPCNECACRAYEQSFPPGEASLRLSREYGAFHAGRAAGDRCMAAKPRECRSMPTPTPKP